MLAMLKQSYSYEIGTLLPKTFFVDKMFNEFQKRALEQTDGIKVILFKTIMCTVFVGVLMLY